MHSIVIEHYPDRLVFRNPGSLLASVEQYFEGGTSICRNSILQKMFEFIGEGERAGIGVDTIKKGWKDNGWAEPVVREIEEPEQVELKLPLGSGVDYQETTKSTTKPPLGPTVVRKNSIEHVLVAIKERLQGTANIVRGILDGEEREQNHHLDNLGTGEFAVGFLFESHLPFRDVYGSKYVHYPLYAYSTAIFCEKIAQFRNNLSIFVHARCIFLFGHSNILKINELTKFFKDFPPSFFR